MPGILTGPVAQASRYLRLAAAALLLSLASPGLSARPATLEQQRAAFTRALTGAEAGDWGRVEPELSLLEDYPLLPDLRGAWLAADVDRRTHEQIADYLSTYPDLYPSARLRWRWLNRLYREQAWTPFLAQYRDHYLDSSDAALHCRAQLARRAAGETGDLAERALALWMVGHSQPRDCDPLFHWLDEQGLLDPDRHRQRLKLALDARSYELAAYLARRLGEFEQGLVELYRRMDRDPESELSRQNFKDTARARSLVLDALGRLARRDPDAAERLWRKRFRRQLSFTRQEQHAMQRQIALWSAHQFQANGLRRMAALPRDAHDADSLAWWARAALRLGDWKAVAKAVAAMPDELASEETWQYWNARATEALGDPVLARQSLLALAQRRSYHGFLAADRLELPYAYDHRPTPADETVQAALAGRADLRRAGELHATGLYTRGRQEWDAAMERLSPAERKQAALLAAGMGWPSRAIATAARQGLIDDLELRFPDAYLEAFEQATRQAGISLYWALGIARSESLFMPDVRSGAGALGLMQLMPATGKATAREYELEYRNSASLLDPDTNIRLGTRYLEKMQARFGQHQLLSTAAYNAGPNRISRWLPQTGRLPADIWVETLPYRETRGYVRRVLEAQVVFAWQLGRQELRLATLMEQVPSSARLQAMVAAGPTARPGAGVSAPRN